MSAPWVWPPVTGTGGGGGGGGNATVLKTNTDRFLDSVNGSDSNNGATAGTAWLTFAPFAALLDSFVAIDDVYARLTILPSDEVDFASLLVPLNIPLLVGSGKVIIRGTDSIGMPASPSGTVSVVADAGSTTTAIHVAAWPSTHNPVGWQLICTAGANVGARRLCSDWVPTEGAGGPTVLTPTAPLDNAGVGDTWSVARPAAGFFADPNGIFQGVGTLPRSIGDGLDPGLYIVNLELQGTPGFLNCEATLLGVDFIGSAGEEGFIFGAGTLGALGELGSTVTAIDPTSGLWSGYGIGTRQEALTSSFVHFIQQFGAALGATNVSGYAIGTCWLADGVGAGGALVGGRLFGEPIGGTEPTVSATGGANLSVAVAVMPVRIDVPSTAPAALFVAGSNSLMFVGAVDFGGGQPVTLLRSTDGATMRVVPGVAAPVGSCFGGDAQDATGGGTIEWDSQPALTSLTGAELRVTGVTASNTLLSAPGLGLVDGLGISRIIRRVTTTPANAASVRYPATEMPPANTGSVFLETTDGAAHTLVPAPPANYLTWWGPQAGVVNAGAAAGTPSISINGLRVDSMPSLAAGTEAQSFDLPSPFVTSFAIVAQRIAGTSAKLQYRGSYSYIPQGNIVTFVTALTASFVSIASIIPPAGFGSRLLAAGVMLNIFDWNLIDNDSVGHSLVFRITRGAIVTTITFAAAGNQMSGNPGMTLLNGDLVEVKTGEAIVTPGSVVLWGLNEFLPLP